MALNTAHAGGVTTTIVNPDELYDPAPNGYSHAVVASGGSRVAYIAGQGGENAQGVLPESFADQVAQAYRNLRTVLQELDASPQQVTRINTYVVNYDPSMLEVMTRYVKETFGDALPAQTLVPVPRLALDGMLFEVDATAVLE
ncbi:RidA family protein [Vreelandella titanicae]|uniref:RidA family protein n=1 Tax=Vreelandella titanicae TaxID=664683 RepID=UPI001AD73678|nr:Rid family hydrolase [Halomonas titanicae]